MATLRDWLDELNGTSTLDKSEFADLIPRDGDETFLQKAFSQLPNGQSFIHRLRMFFYENNTEGLYVLPNESNRLSSDELIQLSTLYGRKVADFMVDRGRPDLALHALNPQVLVANNNSDFLNIIQTNQFEYSDIADEFNDAWIDILDASGEYMYTLEEAVYSLTNYPGITRYLLEEVVSFPMKNKAYYDLWKAGGDVYFFADTRVVLCPTG